jgi:hypothetical protein
VPDLLLYPSFVLLGLLAGFLGTLVGLGGGFILMPALLILFPNEPSAYLTATSLSVVFCNAISGSIAYARQRRIDYRSGLIFAGVAIPGTIIGALSTDLVSRSVFTGVFGVVLIAGSLFLILRPPNQNHAPSGPPLPGFTTRSFTDSQGNTHTYNFRLRTGILISFCVGVLSSFLGVGGGIIQVPALIYLLNFPVHIATATAIFMQAITSFSAAGTHILDGTLTHGFINIFFLAIGVICGAQLGAKLSKHLKGRRIVLVLASILIFVGLRLLYSAITQ